MSQKTRGLGPNSAAGETLRRRDRLVEQLLVGGQRADEAGDLGLVAADRLRGLRSSRLQLRHDLLEEAEEQRRDHERQVEDDQPHDLVVGVLLDVEEYLQEVDRGDRDDRRGHLDLEAAGIELAQPAQLRLSASSKRPTKFS